MQSVCKVSNVPVLFQSLNGSSGSSSFFPIFFLSEDDVSSVMWLGRKRDHHDREPARRRRRMRDGRLQLSPCHSRSSHVAYLHFTCGSTHTLSLFRHDGPTSRAYGTSTQREPLRRHRRRHHHHHSPMLGNGKRHARESWLNLPRHQSSHGSLDVTWMCERVIVVEES
jgi:hypothetical protein